MHFIPSGGEQYAIDQSVRSHFRKAQPERLRRRRHRSRGQPVRLENSGKLRIAYQQGAGNSVTCVSSVDQLNRFGLYGSDKLAAYDKHFFDSKALVLVKYTVSSGSTQLSLSSATRVSNMVSVHVDAQSAGMGTSDMATWLLWAEVDKSLSDCQWVLDGASGAGSGVTK